jgi:8-amino-7-oxononanoate synthase
MIDFDNTLRLRLDEIRAQGLHRQLRRVDSPQGPRLLVGGRELLNFSSNDYLGLANHPLLKEAAVKAVEQFGAGSGASRLICGSLAPHHELEDALAAFKHTEAALAFSSGYAAAIGTICALAGKEDVIILDKLVHASIVDAARLSGAKLRIFEHNDLNELEDLLRWAKEKLATETGDKDRHALIITESVFSMDGDCAPLREIAGLKDKYGAWLMVDEAHATGLYGENRRGLAEELGLAGRIEIQMGTLGKALGAAGGYICGQRNLIEYLINSARAFIFSTAPVPAASAAARAGVQLVQSDEGRARCQQLWSLVDEARTALAKNGWPLTPARSAIIPLMIGDETKAVALATALREQGFFIPAIRYPTVARGHARLRLTLTAAHTSGQLASVLEALTSSIRNP